MKKLETVESVVAEILNEREDTRKNDDILYLHVCEHFCDGVSSMTLKDFLTSRKETNCPNFETVRRTRQKVFEKRPELKPEDVTPLRESMINVFVDYAING
jgi:hypothetical protein